MYRLNFIYHRFKHHSSHSGYDRLTHYITGNTIDGQIPLWFSAIIPKKITKFILRRANIDSYNQDRLFNEIRVCIKFFSIKREIFHFLYGENAYCYAGFFSRNKNKKIIATFHQPPKYFERFIYRRNHLFKLDGIVVVSKHQYDYFANIIGKDKVSFIPHGVDTDFFIPGQRNFNNGSPVCLFVGHWLRDFNTLREVIQIVNSKNKDIKFVIVTTPKNLKYVDKLPNTDVLYGVPENELLNLYQRASLLVIPLEDCTTNNSILEGLACGIPIITTDIGGIRDYVDESCAVLIKPRKPEIMAQRALELIDDKQIRDIMSLNARERALNYSWPLIAEQVRKMYLSLFT